MTEKIPNLGPKTEVWMVRVGVTSLAQLRELGAEKVYKMLLDAGHEPNKNLWYGLKAAEMDVHWQVVADEERRRGQNDR